MRELGAAGWLRHAVAGTAYGGASEVIDTRAICLLRETLARYSGLADFAFAMQGLGSGAISLQRTAAQRQRYLPGLCAGTLRGHPALPELSKQRSGKEPHLVNFQGTSARRRV